MGCQAFGIDAPPAPADPAVELVEEAGRQGG
jgi:hypothetical protein